MSGPVAETHDLLFDSALAAFAQTILPIRHLLVAPGPVPLEELRVIRSHPAALEQCRRLLSGLPDAAVVAAATTADAARIVSRRATRRRRRSRACARSSSSVSTC